MKEKERLRLLELLSPAKNLECGMAAIDHGADAVYIGAPHFGARAAASNSVDDIRSLCEYAHTYRAKVYVTVNTILFDNELKATEDMIRDLYDAGADAILVQDMSLLEMNLPPIALHASTQTDNRTKEKVAWLASKGFDRVVLARELSVRDISSIHAAVPGVELEVFVHGALCVSYSGVCYASSHCFGRSANRGECAQFCRLKFDLEDSTGRVIERGKHFLSLKDMSRLRHLDALARVGVTSFKIEGRLKDISYVKNVTAAYSKALDELIAMNPGLYRRASLGKCEYSFEPDVRKTFNRGFTDYFIDGQRSDIASFDTPKAIGEYVGKVKEIRRDGSFSVAGTASFTNGDGLCFMNGRKELEGFRVNRAEGNRIFPYPIQKNLRKGDILYRNNNQAFSKQLAHKSAERKMDIQLVLSETDCGFSVTAAVCGTDIKEKVEVIADKQEAKTPQTDNITRQLTKLGNTPFVCKRVEISPSVFPYFIPSSVLSGMRRDLTEKLVASLRTKMPVQEAVSGTARMAPDFYPEDKSYMYNVSNKLSRKFYTDEGLGRVDEAFELHEPAEKLIMQCRHCVKYSLGCCPRHGGTKPSWVEPLYLRLADGRRFRLRFNCSECQMNVYADS